MVSLIASTSARCCDWIEAKEKEGAAVEGDDEAYVVKGSRTGLDGAML